jgi:hypothetical protein
MALADGEKLKYACREFVKGQGNDEERLMRRIMIARRNNLRDHETLKKARKLRGRVSGGETGAAIATAAASTSSNMASQSRTVNNNFAVGDIKREMDVTAVESTRSYQKWLKLPPGSEFVYNQRYIKGKDGDDWLLKKNIWRRMRYRRMNKKMVETLKTIATPSTAGQGVTSEQNLSSNAAAPLSTQSANNASNGIHDMMMEGILHGSGMAAQSSSSTLTRPHPHDLLHSSGIDVATSTPDHHDHSAAVSSSAQQAAATAAAAVADHFADAAAIEAAVAAAERFGKANGTSSNHNSDLGSHDHFLAHHSLHSGVSGTASSSGDGDAVGSHHHHNGT